MHELTQILKLHGGQVETLGVWELLFALTLSLICSMSVGHIYRYTHRSVGYSQSFVQTLILTSLVTTLIMIVIGSNIARAFSLVGALSIIRFRNAVKETRDVGYIFFAMAIAMSCGTRFYNIAFMATAFINLTLLGMFFFNYGDSRVTPEKILKVQLPPDLPLEGGLQDIFKTLFSSFSLIKLENVKQGMAREAVYSVRPLQKVKPEEIIDKITAINQNLKVSYHYEGHTDEL
jgi:hypothetical protein